MQLYKSAVSRKETSGETKYLCFNNTDLGYICFG